MNKTHTPRTTRAIQTAAYWAKSSQLDAVDLTLLTAAILMDASSVAFQMLDNMGKEMGGGDLAAAIAKATRKNYKTPINNAASTAISPPNCNYTETVNEALQLAETYTSEPSVGTEHVLAAIWKVNLRTNELTPILQNLGISPDDIVAFFEAHCNKSNSMAGGPATPPQANNVNPLEAFCRNLTQLASEGKLDNITGRATQVQQIFTSLSRRRKNNVMIIGESGVGKTALMEAVAQAITNKSAPAKFHTTEVFQLNLGQLMAGTIYRGLFEDRLKAVIAAIEQKNAILSVDDFHTTIGAGNGEDKLDAANLLKASWASGKCRTIGATSRAQWDKIITHQDDIRRMFRPMELKETTKEETRAILQALAKNYGEHHSAVISDATLDACIKLGQRYVRDRQMPDKAIDLLDEACAAAKYNATTSTADQQKLRELEQAKQKAIVESAFEEAAHILKEQKAIQNRTINTPVTPDHVAEIVSQWTQIPVNRIQQGDVGEMKRSEKIIRSGIIGQDKAVTTILSALRRARSVLKNPNKPIGSYVLAGPTGVGKTLLAKLACEGLGGSADHLIKFDMGKLQEKHQLSELIGSSPGYVGYRESGKLRKVNHQPLTVILLDEIEKAHPDIFDLFLSIMEDGFIEDGAGKPIYFHDTLLLMTTNLGTSEAARHTMGFTTDVATAEEAHRQESTRKAIQKHFRPEFINRLDDIIVFNPLSKEQMHQVLTLELKSIESRHADLHLQLTPAMKNRVLELGFDPNMGARPLKRALQTCVEDPVINSLEDQQIVLNRTIIIDYADEKITVTNEPTTVTSTIATGTTTTETHSATPPASATHTLQTA